MSRWLPFSGCLELYLSIENMALRRFCGPLPQWMAHAVSADRLDCCETVQADGDDDTRRCQVFRKRPALPSSRVKPGWFGVAKRKQVVDVAVAAGRQFLEGALEPSRRVEAIESGGAEQRLNRGGATAGTSDPA